MKFPATACSVLILVVASAAAQTDVAALRSVLLEVTDADYVAARDTALALPQGGFADLLTLLELADPISLDRIIADAIRTRKEHPAVAAEFDHRLEHSIQNPVAGRGGRIYRAWWPYDRFDLDPLAFEAYIKLDLPSDGLSLKQSFRDFMNRSNSANINRLLYLAKQHGVGYVGFLAQAAEGDPQEQVRITPIIVEQHKYWREHGQITDSAIHVLARFGTELQLDALNEIKIFEQQRLAMEGLTPWDDQSALHHLTTAYSMENQAKAALYQAEREGQPQHILSSLTAALEQRKQAVHVASRRLSAKVMWDQLELVIVRLNVRLNP